MKPREPDRWQSAVSQPMVAVILLNWNTWEITRDCLHALEQLDYGNYIPLLVDNASSDGSADRLAAIFPHLTILRNSRNLGFAGGSNVGICYALQHNADYVLLLNNDTIVSPSFLSRMVNVAQRDPQIGAVGPTIYYDEPSDRLWYAGGDFSVWHGFARHHGLQKRASRKLLRTRPVTFVSGCALLIRSMAIRRVGLLDEEFFMVCEDTDWCVRAMRAGYTAMYAADAVIWHRDSFTVKRHVGKSLRDYYGIRNTLWLARKHLRYYHWPSFVTVLAGRVIWRTAGYTLRGEFNRVAALYRGLLHGFRARGASQAPTLSKPEPLDVAT